MRTLGMKETVLSAKTSGTARKRFEVIVEVIKKNPPQKQFFFLRRAFFTFSELVRFSRSGSHMTLLLLYDWLWERGQFRAHNDFSV